MPAPSAKCWEGALKQVTTISLSFFYFVIHTVILSVHAHELEKEESTIVSISHYNV
jgi:hypothetical protein